MIHTDLKSAHYTSQKFEGVREYYIVENNDDLKKLVKKFPALRNSWKLIRERILNIIHDGYVALVSDIIPSSHCIEVGYENIIPHKYTYSDAYHRVY
jgi:hypothetical protein